MMADIRTWHACGGTRRKSAVYPMWTALFCLVLAGCGEGEPTVFARGESIPLGEGTLKVFKAEMTSQFLPTYIGTKTGMVNAIVSFVYETPRLQGNKAAKEKMAVVASLKPTLVNEEGKKFGTPLILPARQYRLMLAGQSQDMEAMKSYLLESSSEMAGDDFVAIFVIPQGSRELTARFVNPAPQSGQARLAAVTVW